MSSAFAAPRGAGPQQSAVLWLAVRLSLNVRGAAAIRLLWLSAGVALATVPLTIWLAAVMGAELPGWLPTGQSEELSGALASPLSASWLGLALATCPGAALSIWVAQSLAADRAATAEALRQVGAERAVGWLLPAARVALASVIGVLGGALCLTVLRTTLFRHLPMHSPLRAALTAAGDGSWVLATFGVILLLTGGALFFSGAGQRAGSRIWHQARPRLAAFSAKARARLRPRR